MRKTMMRAGACLSALVLLGAATASAASAVQFHTESSPSYPYGAGTLTFSFPLLGSERTYDLECTNSSLTSETTGTALKTLALDPKIYGCEDYQEFPVQVTVNSCRFRFNQPNASGQSTLSLLQCPSTAPIVIKFTANVGNCTVKISEAGNSNLSGVTFGAQGSGTSRALETNLAVSAVGTGSNCWVFSPSSTKISMQTTLRAYKDASHTIQQGLWLE